MYTNIRVLSMLYKSSVAASVDGQWLLQQYDDEKVLGDLSFAPV